MSVVMLEEGEHHTTDDMSARPRDMAARLYRDAGQSVTAGNVPIMLPLGRSVGGTTLVNSGTCFRAPDRVLESWRREFGLEALSPEALDPYFASRVEQLIDVAQVPPELAGRNARGGQARRRRARLVGRLHATATRKGCVGSGVCAFGCPTSAKQHTGRDLRAARLGRPARSPGPAAARSAIVVERGRARAVEARTARRRPAAGGGDHVIVACGTIHTPLLLAPQPDRPGVGPAGREPRDPSRHRRARAVRRGDRHVARRAAVALHRRVRRRGHHVRGRRRAARLPRDELPVLARAPARADAELHAPVPVRRDGLATARAARVRSRAGRVADPLRAERARTPRSSSAASTCWRSCIGPPARARCSCRSTRAPRGRSRRATLKLLAFHPLGTARAHASPVTAWWTATCGVHGVEGLHVSDASVDPALAGGEPPDHDHGAGHAAGLPAARARAA